MNNQIRKHIMILRVDNKPGVVSRVAGLFTRRGYNIESFVTSVTQDPAVYQLTISVIATPEEVSLLVHQLGRIMEVIDISLAENASCVIGELMFIKLRCPESRRASVMTEIAPLTEALELKIAGVGENSIILQMTGDELKLDSAVRALSHLGIDEVIRSGSVSALL